MVLAVVVGLSDGQRAERGVTQLTVVVLCGQDDPRGPLVQRLQAQTHTETHRWVRSREEEMEMGADMFV